MIYQIPEGSIQVSSSKTMDMVTQDVDSMGTRQIVFSFYFPTVGEYKCYRASALTAGYELATSDIPEKLVVKERV